MRASWGRDFARLHRPQRARHPAPARGGAWRRGVPRLVYASSSSVYGDAAGAPPARGRACQPVSPYGVTKLAAEHLANLYDAQPRPARGQPALLHGLRTAPAAGHGLPPVPEGGARRGAHPRSSGTASQTRDFTYVSTTSWPPPGPPPTPGGPAASTTSGAASASSLTDVLGRIEEVTGRRLTVDPGRRPERRHEGHLRRHHRRAPGPRLPLDGLPRRGAGPGMGVDPGAGVRRLVRAGLIAGLLAARPARTAQPDIATLTSNSDQVIWDAGQKALQKKDWESRPPALPADHRRLPAEPVRAVGAARPRATPTSRRAGPPTTSSPSGAYREFLTLYPSHPKSDYAQFQVAEAYFRQRNGPDRDQTDTQDALEEYERLLDLYPDSPVRREGARRGSRSSARAWPGPSSWPATSTSGRAQFCRASIARYEVVLKDYPGLRRPGRGAVPAGGMPPRPGTDGRRRSPTWAGCSRSTRRAPRRRPRAASWQSGRTPPPPARRPPPTRPAGSLSPAPPKSPPPPPAPVARRRKLKCHFRICKKVVDETFLFLLASPKFRVTVGHSQAVVVENAAR